MMSTDSVIGDRGATALSEALKSNKTLTELNLSCEDKKHAKGIRQQFIFFLLSSYQQATRLEKEGQHH